MKSFSVFLRHAGVAALILACSLPAQADSHVVAQTKKAFTVPVVKAKIGDTITFRNDDDFAHNVFSLSDSQSFDLGSYKKGESRNVKLTTAGVIEVECAIHPEMKMKVEVAK
jgi:plastocyanin